MLFRKPKAKRKSDLTGQYCSASESEPNYYGDFRRESGTMSQQQKQDWRHLAEQASREMDPDKLMSLVNELNQVLEQNEKEAEQRSGYTPQD
jgi:hypothetical protein